MYYSLCMFAIDTDTGSADLGDVMPYKECRVVWRGRVPPVHSDAMLCGGLPLQQIVRGILSVVERPAHPLPFASLLRPAPSSSVLACRLLHSRPRVLRPIRLILLIDGHCLTQNMKLFSKPAVGWCSDHYVQYVLWNCCFGLFWEGFGLVWLGLVCFGWCLCVLVWFVLFWFGLVWFVLAWFG